MVRPVLWAVLLMSTQLDPHRPPRDPSEERRLPDGRSQTEAILKDEHKRSMRELEEMAKLVEEVRVELEKTQHHVVSMGVIKKLEEVEKRSKRIRDRLRR